MGAILLRSMNIRDSKNIALKSYELLINIKKCFELL